MELNQSIKCNIFSDTEAVIKKAEDKIKETRSIKERRYYTQDILLEAEALMSCSNYNNKKQDCLDCHLVSVKYIQEYKHLAHDEMKESLLDREG